MIGYFAARKAIQSGRFSPVYLFCGEEDFLKEELTGLLCATFLGAEGRYGLEKMDGAAVSLADVLASLEGGSLFAARRLAVVKNPSCLAPPAPKGKEKEKEGAAPEAASGEKDERSTEPLERFLRRESPGGQPEKIIVFHAGAADRRRRLFKLLDREGTVVDCAPLRGEALAAWIRDRVAAAGKKIERDALERLLLAGDTNLNRLSRELDKYITYLGEGETTITAAVVELLYSGDTQGNVFNLADAFGEGRPERALELLHLLFRRREEPLFIFFMLVRHFRLLLLARSLRDGNVPPQKHAAALGVQPFVARKLFQQSARFTRRALEDIYLLLQDTDRRIKTGRIDPRQALELIITEAHGERNTPGE